MNYDELAQRIVALGYGIKIKMTAGHHSWWVYSYNQTAEQFCNDGRTVLTMMQMVPDVHYFSAAEGGASICESCCEVLEGEK